jgi:hypothetical protein
MKEPIERGFSILKKQVSPEPRITYTLPDGSTTIWLNEYTDALIQAEQDRIVKLLEDKLPGAKRVGAFYASAIEDAIELAKGERE